MDRHRDWAAIVCLVGGGQVFAVMLPRCVIEAAINDALLPLVNDAPRR